MSSALWFIRSVLVLCLAAAFALPTSNAAHAASVTLDFPSEDSTLSGSGGCNGLLGAGGGGVCFTINDTLTETFSSTGLFGAIGSTWSFQMDNQTKPVSTSTFDVTINGIVVDSFQFSGVPSPVIETINLTNSFAPIAGDTYTLSIIATSTVPSGLSSWNFLPGGSVTLTDTVSATVPLPATSLLLLAGLTGLGWTARRKGQS